MDKIREQIEQVLVFVDLQQCQIERASLETFEEEEVTLNVFLTDHKGQPIYDAADIFTVEVTTPTMDNVATSVEELDDGQYSVYFTPTECGDHTASIQINGMHISKSPMNVEVEQLKLVAKSSNTVPFNVIQPSMNTFSFAGAAKQERPTTVTTSEMAWGTGILIHSTAMQNNTHSTVVTCTNNRLWTPSPVTAVTPPQPSPIGIQPQPPIVGKSISPQPKTSLIFNLPKVTPRSKSRHQTHGGW